MPFDQWSEDAYKALGWWYELLVSLVAHPDRLVVGNGQVDQLYAKAWPLAVAMTIAFLLAAASFMIVAFGKGTEYVAKAIKVAVVVFVCSIAAREISPIFLRGAGSIGRSLIGDTTALPFPDLGKGIGPLIGYGIAIIVVALMCILVIALAPLIIVTAGLIVLSYAARVLGTVGEKQWQFFLSAFLTSHLLGVLIFAGFIRLALNTKNALENEVVATIFIIAIFIIAIVLVGASFYLTYVATSHVTGGRLKADSHNEGGEIDRIGSGNRTEPQVHQDEPRWENYDTQGPSTSPDGGVPPSSVRSSGRTASSSGLEIGLRDASPHVQAPTGTPDPVDSSGPPRPPERTTSDGTTPQSGQSEHNLRYPVEVLTDKNREPHLETDTPQWREESPVPAPLPYPDAERTEEIPIQEPHRQPAPLNTTHEYPSEPALQLSGVEYIENSRRELGLEDYALQPQPANNPESGVRNEPAIDTGPQFD